jgi:hypothetical protein
MKLEIYKNMQYSINVLDTILTVPAYLDKSSQIVLLLDASHSFATLHAVENHLLAFLITQVGQETAVCTAVCPSNAISLVPQTGYACNETITRNEQSLDTSHLQATMKKVNIYMCVSTQG